MYQAQSKMVARHQALWRRVGRNWERPESKMFLISRRSVIHGATAFGIAALTTGRIALAESGSATDILSRSRHPLSGNPLALPGFTGLEFDTAWPEKIGWSEDTEQVSDFDQSGLFSEFRRLWSGYDPEDRDQLTFSVYCARIIPERVAVAPDYARLLASVWGPENYGVFGDDRDFGEVMTGTDEGGSNRRTRISVWRRDTDLLILRADTTLEDSEAQTAALAAAVGSLAFVRPVEDGIITSLQTHRLRLPSGAHFDFHLPPHWRAFDTSKAEASPVAATVWLDGADEGGNGAIGIFGIAVPKGARSQDAPMREIATAMSDLMIENLAPQINFSRENVTEYQMKGFLPDAAQAMFIDRITNDDDAQRMAATGFFLSAPNDVLGFSALTIYPTDQERTGIMMHSTFIHRLVLDDLRAQFGSA